MAFFWPSVRSSVSTSLLSIASSLASPGVADLLGLILQGVFLGAAGIGGSRVERVGLVLGSLFGAIAERVIPVAATCGKGKGEGGKGGSDGTVHS
jgi:hypothetical protein